MSTIFYKPADEKNKIIQFVTNKSII